MSCRHCTGAGRVFNDRTATRQLKRFLRKGPARTTRWLLDQLRDAGVREMTVLDIGGGVGAIQLELLEAGATLATGIDASPSYVTVAEAEARRRGFDDRVQHHVGDFVDWADELEDADIVTLDRVVCCYPAMERLVALSARRARRFYGLVFPRDDWWVRLFMVVPNLFMHMTRNPFRVFVHPTEAVEAAVSGQGLRRRYHRKTAVWQVILYERA